MSPWNVFSARSNVVYPLSGWNLFVCHRCSELYALCPGNVLCFARCDELYAVCPGDIFDDDRSNNSVLYTV